MTDTEHAKLSFYATSDSMAALRAAAERLGLNHTDTLNRAVRAYNALLAAKPDDVLVLTNPDGSTVALVIGR